LLKQTRSRFPFVEHIYADREYSGAKTAAMVCSTGCWKIGIVKRSDAHRFCRTAQALDRGADIRVDQLQSEADATVRLYRQIAA
jgi:hypothetical protein